MSPTQMELGNYQKSSDEQPASKAVSIKQFLSEVRAEFLKISWPSRDQTTREFIAVILLVFIITGIIFLIDKMLGFVLALFTGKGF